MSKSVRDRASELRVTIRDLTQQLKVAEAELSIIYRNCPHDWRRSIGPIEEITPTGHFEINSAPIVTCVHCGLVERL